jgi:hypothetical protein
MVKKIIINIVIVFFVTLAIDFAFGRMLRYFYFKEKTGLHFRTTYVMESNRADILIFGSSTASHHYIPDIFETSMKMSCYNAGRDNTCIFYQTAILKSVLKRYSPRIIVLDFPGVEIEMKEYDQLSSLLPYYRTHEEIRNILELKSPFEKIKLLSEIYPFNSQFSSIVVGYLKINKKIKPDNNGYIALNNQWIAYFDSIPNSNNYLVDSKKLSSFREFISLAKGSRAKVFVVYPPLFQKCDNRQEIEVCNRICNSENVPFWDFSNDSLFLYNKQLFHDLTHLNHEGAIVFSNLVVKKLKAELK